MTRSFAKTAPGILIITVKPVSLQGLRGLKRCNNGNCKYKVCGSSVRGLLAIMQVLPAVHFQ
jgi:hypothetical protein